jgi:ABC-2 type transport system ATP-binding protein
MSIKISHLTKKYGTHRAVDDLTIEIPSGTIFGLLGPNGAGKTTTFKCMLDLARSDDGSVEFYGKSLAPELFERIVYIPERDVLYEWMRVSELVEMNRRTFKKFNARRALDLLQTFGIDTNKRARSLSKGMKTAVAVATAFAREADILVLDEPTSGLDPVNQRHVLNLMVNEAARGATVVFSSHQIGQVERAAERIAILDRGKLVLEGAVDDLKANRKVVEAIFPDEGYSIDGLASDKRVARVERSGRIVRIIALGDAASIAQRLEALGGSGVRVLDLNLEDIFFNAVAPASEKVPDHVVEGS